MAVTWADLANLRRRGMRPAFPVFVTDRRVLARNMADVGCVVIWHEQGQPMPVKLLDGLDVRLAFARCELAGAVKRLLDAREVTLTELRAWCSCAGGFVACCGPCDKGDEPWSD